MPTIHQEVKVLAEGGSKIRDLVENRKYATWSSVSEDKLGNILNKKCYLFLFYVLRTLPFKQASIINYPKLKFWESLIKGLSTMTRKFMNYNFYYLLYIYLLHHSYLNI